jgi:hypothetical protein
MNDRLILLWQEPEPLLIHLHHPSDDTPSLSGNPNPTGAVAFWSLQAKRERETKREARGALGQTPPLPWLPRWIATSAKPDAQTTSGAKSDGLSKFKVLNTWLCIACSLEIISQISQPFSSVFL